LFGDTLSFVQH